jgi:hypothetical protein
MIEHTIAGGSLVREAIAPVSFEALPERQLPPWMRARTRYVRGPEGLIVELAERLDGAPG